MRVFKELAQNVYPKAIIIRSERPRPNYTEEAIAARFGLAVRDFIWITTHPSWRRKVEGISRTVLVLDPMFLTSSYHDDNGFAIGILTRFDNIARTTKCASALAEWLKDRNPDQYRRMVEAGVYDGENVFAKAIGHECGPIEPPLSP